MNKLGKSLVLFLAISGFSFFLSSPAVSAVSASEFNPGRIIDDAIFYNKNAMGGAQEVQNFLNTHVPACDTWGTGPSGYGNLTKAQYAQQMGWHGPPYACLQNYHENPSNGETSFEKGGGAFTGGQSAAQIIWNAAQEYGINPQVLIVMLRKESAGPLTADNWPLKTQYKYAMGYGCPDSGPNYSANCDATKSGFYNQMRLAAWQLRYYANNINTYNYRPGRTNYIQYSPDPNCGGKNVYIENIATASLYIYTPYVPNDAALNAYPGTAPCGAYGNRNFFMMFNDWFGGVNAPNYLATYSSQGAYPVISQTQSSTITLRYKNGGNKTWYHSATAGAAQTEPVVLATIRPVNRCSSFVTGSWYTCTRPTGLFTKVYESNGTTLASNQHIVQPNQIAEYTFDITAPSEAYTGNYDEYFAPIREGAPNGSWYMGADNVFMRLGVKNAYVATFSGQSPYTTISQNDRTDSFIRFKNNGVLPWYDSTTAAANNVKPVVLATDGPVNRKSNLGPSWPNSTRPGTTFSKVYEADGLTLAQNQHIVSIGQIVQFDFKYTATATQRPDSYREYMQLIREGAMNFIVENSGAHLDITVKPSNYSASYSTQNSYLTLSPLGTGQMYYDLKNTGHTTWYDDQSWTPGILPVHLATTNSINRASKFTDPSWPNSARPATTFAKVYLQDGSTLSPDQHKVQPGQIARFEFTVKAPSNNGTYREDFQPIIEGAPGYSWNMGGAVWQPISVQ